MQVTYDQFIEENCHLNNAVQRCYLQMRDCDVKAETLRTRLRKLQGLLEYLVSCEPEEGEGGAGHAMSEVGFNNVSSCQQVTLYQEMRDMHEELGRLGKRKIDLAKKAFDL